MNNKKILSFALAALFIIILISCSQSEQTEVSLTSESLTDTAEINSDTTANVPEKTKISATFEVEAYIMDESTKSAHQVSEGEIYGIRISCTESFHSFSYCLPTWCQTDSEATLALYRWDSDFETTTTNAPLAWERFTDIADCATYTLSFENMPAGEYFFAIQDTKGPVGTWVFPSHESRGLIYDTGLISEGDLQLKIGYSTDTPEPFAEVINDMRIDGTHTAPPEYIIPENDILKVRDAMPDTWAATDTLGRTLCGNAEAGDLKEDKIVAMFYWDWHNSDRGTPLNVTEFLKQHPEIKNDYKSELWPTAATTYFWDEPIYGHYLTTDEWVIRRQAELLADAGVDVIFMDNTNGTFTWRASYLTIFKVFEQARKDGVNVPKISFMLPFAAGDNTAVQLKSLYTDIYRPGKYHDLWFYLDGKPMLMAYRSSLTNRKNDPLEKEIYDFFTFRAGEPVYNAKDYYARSSDNARWGWLSTTPQALYYTYRDNLQPEMTTVGVAQNWSAEVGLTAMNGENIFGRTYTTEGYDESDNAKSRGGNFAEQWEFALSVDPRIVFVTGWNEWIAGRYEFWPHDANGQRNAASVDNAFPDEFDETFSRDIEPTKGELKDSYYYQLVNYIRRFKGARAVPVASGEKTIDIYSSDVSAQWADVKPLYYAYMNNTGNRDASGYGGIRYEDASGRNDIIEAQAARDNEYFYFLVRCGNKITPYTDDNWMNLYIDADINTLSSWASFDFIVNKTKPGADKAILERFSGNDGTTETVCEVEYKVHNDTMTIKIPKSTLGVDSDDFAIGFKWTDNIPFGDIMDFYIKGDTAPSGRFKYVYKTGE